jgi:hypothetical protein
MPDERNFGQITQNRPPTIFLGPEKLVAGKWPILYLANSEKICEIADIKSSKIAVAY